MATPQQTCIEEIKVHDSLFLLINKRFGNKEICYILVKKDFITFYKKTILGPIWFFIQSWTLIGRFDNWDTNNYTNR